MEATKAAAWATIKSSDFETEVQKWYADTIMQRWQKKIIDLKYNMQDCTASGRLLKA